MAPALRRQSSGTLWAERGITLVPAGHAHAEPAHQLSAHRHRDASPFGLAQPAPAETTRPTPWPLKIWTWTTTPASPRVGLASCCTYSESSPSSNMQVGGSGVALARDTRADLGRESAVLIIRHVIGRGCHMRVIEPAQPAGLLMSNSRSRRRGPKATSAPSVISRCGTLSRPTAGDGVREGRSQVSRCM